jgi:hypothetical protein
VFITHTHEKHHLQPSFAWENHFKKDDLAPVTAESRYGRCLTVPTALSSSTWDFETYCAEDLQTKKEWYGVLQTWNKNMTNHPPVRLSGLHFCSIWLRSQNQGARSSSWGWSSSVPEIQVQSHAYSLFVHCLCSMIKIYSPRALVRRSGWLYYGRRLSVFYYSPFKKTGGRIKESTILSWYVNWRYWHGYGWLSIIAGVNCGSWAWRRLSSSIA